MTAKRGTESWVSYQVRQIKTQILQQVRTRIAAAKPSDAYVNDALQTARIAGHQEMQAQARNIINDLIEEANLATAEHDKRTARADRAAD